MRTEIERLKKDLEKFDQILLFSGEMQEKIMKDFCSSQALKKTEKKVLMLSSADPFREKEKNYGFRRISDREREELEQLYRTYEFSNRFQVVSDHFQWGSLMNYVKTGMVTMEEFFEALLS